jgi:hypothetical protein
MSKELAAEVLRRTCDPQSLKFTTTDELPRLQEVIGQPRAFRALEMGSEISGKGFNIIAVGLPGSGRTTLTREFLERKAAKEAVPSDWCYVNNFSNPRCPQALKLPPGKAVALRDELNNLIHQVKLAIPEAFKTEEYAAEQERLTAALNEFKEAESNRLQSLAKNYNFVIARTPFGYTLLPALEGQPLKPEDLEKLTQEQRQKLARTSRRGAEEEPGLYPGDGENYPGKNPGTG